MAAYANGTGSSIVVGYFNGSALFGSTPLLAKGGADMLVAKLDGTGKVVWANSAGGNGAYVAARSVALSPTGDVQVTGSLMGTVSFGSTTVSTGTAGHAFVAGFDSTGTPLNAVAAGGTSNSTEGQGIAVDPKGRRFVTGNFFRHHEVWSCVTDIARRQ